MLGNKMLYMLITNMKELMYDVTTINVALKGLYPFPIQYEIKEQHSSNCSSLKLAALTI